MPATAAALSRARLEGEAGEDGEDAGAASDGGAGPSAGPKLPKRKVALLLGYCGRNYYGMQVYG